MRIMDLPVAHEDGSFVSERISRVVELIRDYDSRLDVRWIPPHVREPGDAAFAIVELTPEGPRTAFLVQTEEEFDERVLARIYEADGSKHDTAAKLAALTKAEADLRRKEREDAFQDLRDKAAFLIKTPLHSPRINGKKIRT